MIDIPLDAEVECTDDKCGVSTFVVIDPTTQKVTHIVVKDQTLPIAVDRMVPAELIDDTTSDLIRLSCTVDEFLNMEPFIEKRFIQTEVARYSVQYSYATQTYPYSTTMMPVDTYVEEHNIPEGELAFHRGTLVEATDGHIGEIGEFLIDPESRLISHFVLERGHLWGKRELVIPVSAIDRYSDDILYLKLEKEEIKELPGIPVRHNWSELHVSDVELVTSLFDKSNTAEEALKALREAKKKDEIEVLNAAIVIKDEDGKTSYKETGDLHAKRGAVFGALVGGLFGIVGGPAGIVTGAAIGAATGGVAANVIDMGFPDEFLESIEENLKDGSSALIILVEKDWTETLKTILDRYEGIQSSQVLTDEMVTKFLEAKE
jgi:uncharacterized membrane protein